MATTVRLGRPTLANKPHPDGARPIRRIRRRGAGLTNRTDRTTAGRVAAILQPEHPGRAQFLAHLFRAPRQDLARPVGGRGWTRRPPARPWAAANRSRTD